MSKETEHIAELLRQEPSKLLSNNCFIKSVRFKKQCRSVGIEAQVAVCIGHTRAKWFGHWLTIPVIHGWGEVEGKRIELSRPLGQSGIWNMIPVDIRPVIVVRLNW